MRRTYKPRARKKAERRRKKKDFIYSLFLVPFALCLIPSLLFGNPIFTDSLGRQVTPKVYPPQRVISLAPNITEILYAIGAQNQVIGVTDFCKYPPEAQQKEKVGGFINPNLEKIVSLNPDMVIVTSDSDQKKVFDQLLNLKIPIFVIDPEDLESTFNAIQMLGELTDKKESAKKVVEGLKFRVEKIKQKLKNAPKPKVLFLWSEDPLITAGKNTFTDNLIQLAGGVNIAHDSNIKYPKFSTEEILRRKPDIIISSAMGGDKGKSNIAEQWKTWTEIPAIKNNKIYSFDADLLSRPAPSIVDGLEKLAQVIHPELFGK